MNNLLKNLNKEQLSAVTHGEGPLLIVAGAGTGKTTVITRRIAYLIEQKLAKPEEILSLTFTEKAAGEMQERVDILMPLGYFDTWISTFHGFCERILKNHTLDIGLPGDFELIDGVRQWILVHNNFEKFNLDYYRPLGNPDRFIDALLQHFSRCKDELITPEDYLSYAEHLRLSLDSAEKAIKPKNQRIRESEKSELRLSDLSDSRIDPSEIARIEEVANAYHVYQKLLLDNNYLDFGDLINRALDLFKKRPKILEYYQKKFKYILVDEFQDTNFAQYQLVRMLADRSGPIYGPPLKTDESTDYNSRANLVVVGDDDQSIYKFRGASVSNILKFREDYPKAALVTLLENYRSTQNILDLAYNFIQANNPDRLEVKLNINKKLKSSSKEQGIIRVLEGQDLSHELDLVAKKIVELKTNDPQATWNDFAILIRANSAADELLPVLQSHGLPFTFVANKGLFKKPIILDLLSYMRLLNNAYESASLYRVLNLPKFHLEHRELSALLEQAKLKTLTLYESLNAGQTMGEISSEGKKKIQVLLDYLKKHTALSKTATAAEIMVEIVKDLGFEQRLKIENLETAEARELLEQFYKKIEEFEKQNSHRELHSFLHQLDLEMQAGNEGAIKFDPNLGPESIKVITIHSAKGLEFKYVFITNLVEQRFPTRQRKEAIEIPDALIKDILPEGDFHLQEERRLFYVAVTRAKQGLFLTWGKDYGGQRLKKSSQFLLETNLVPSEKISKATGKVIFSKPVKLTQVYHKLPTRFSYTELANFQSCPLKYKYSNYLKLPVRGSQQQSFGSTIHKVFEEFLKIYKNNLEMTAVDLFGQRQAEKPLPDFKFLEKFYAKYWIDEWYVSKQEKEKYRKEGQKILAVFYENLKTNSPKPKYIEKFFKLKIGQFDFVGKIDRIDQIENGISILDYKTGKAPKGKNNLDQLHVYQWAAQEFGEKVASLSYWYLQDDRCEKEKLASPERLEELRQELLEVMSEIVETVKYNLFKKRHAELREHNCGFEDLE